VTLVVDASVALKWFVGGEPLAAEALDILHNQPALIAPDLVIPEVCNGAWRQAKLGLLDSKQISDIARALPRCFEALVSAAGLAERAVMIASHLNHPVYDCLYLALAERRGCPLVTADTQLLRKAQGSGICQTVPLSDHQGNP
jgi:predicted nucleic acid-binding protein